MGATLTPTGLTLMRVGWISISLGVMATPVAEEVITRGLTTISWVLTDTPVALSVTKHGLRGAMHHCLSNTGHDKDTLSCLYVTSHLVIFNGD